MTLRSIAWCYIPVHAAYYCVSTLTLEKIVFHGFILYYRASSYKLQGRQLIRRVYLTTSTRTREKSPFETRLKDHRTDRVLSAIVIVDSQRMACFADSETWFCCHFSRRVRVSFHIRDQSHAPKAEWGSKAEWGGIEVS